MNQRVAILLIVGVISFLPGLESVYASGVPFQTGDVLAGVGNGIIKHFSPNGTLLDTLDTGAGYTEDTGMAFDSAGNLYATVFEANNIYKFDNKGNLISSFGSGYNEDPESIVIDTSGNLYVGQADGSAQVLKFSPSGVLLASYTVNREDRGSDWVDLAPDQCTLHYTSEGSSIKCFNLCTGTQLPDFATGLPSPCYAHRIRPNSEELVACTSQIVRLDSSGAVIQNYFLPGSSLLFALNLDPDNKTFWTADLPSGMIYRVDIDTGNIVTQFNAGIYESLAGLTVVGEITASTVAPPATTSYYVDTPNSDLLAAKGKQLAQAQVNGTASQDGVVALLFGRPVMVGQAYGASLWGHSTSVTDIASLVQDFVVGYYNALGANKVAHVRIIVATSNSGKNVTAAHGAAWAQMVNGLASWVVTQGYSGQVDIAGGNNIEPDFNGTTVTRAWVDGYASTAKRFMYNVGAASGCPSTAGAEPAACNNGWTQDDFWYVSWGSVPAEPLPEIYGASNARQWADISLYGYLTYGGSMIFSGAMTESGACAQRPGDPTCAGTSPAQGWQLLYGTLNQNSQTAQTLSWSTDIQWLQ